MTRNAPTSRNKHPAPCDASCPRDKRTPRQKQKAFTLLEVLVALAVLAAGATALGYYAVAFRRVSSAEITRADSSLTAVQYMESLISDPPPCGADTFQTGDKRIQTFVAPSLLWVELRTEHFTFRRLVRCARDSR